MQNNEIGQLSEKRYEMAELYAETGIRVAILKAEKAEFVLEKRASGEARSYADAERMFDITEWGKELIMKEYQLRGYEKLLSAIKTKLEAKFKGY